MPVLMNKGADPRRAAWLFYSPRAVLADFARAAVELRLESGVLTVDAADLAAAGKPGSEVPVWLQVQTLVPEDVDLEAARGEVVERARHAAEQAVQDAEKVGEPSASDAPVANGSDHPGAQGDESMAPTDAAGSDEDLGDPSDPEATDDADAPEPDGPAYEPVPAPADMRLPLGTTTRLAAENYLREQELDGAPWCPELPGLQMLAQFLDLMAGSGQGLPNHMIWHVDEGGIMRMAPAKQIKPMAGNTLKVKL